MDNINLNSFLKFGYFLNFRNPRYTIDLSRIDKSKFKNLAENELIDEGIRLWKKTIESIFELNQKHVVPLSGGLDSRAILATLLEFTEASNINTYTFGSPDTFDYDIGNEIAEIVGTKHTRVPLVNYNYTMEELLEISKRIYHQTVLFHHPPLSVLENLYSDFNIWSGTIIDVFFGRHTHKFKARDWYDAIQNSFKENYFTQNMDLTSLKEEDFFRYVDYDENLKNVLVLEHVIDLLNRQLKFIAPHVLINGFKYKLLFTNSDLSNFALSIDNIYLEDQYLYKKMFLKAFPNFFAFPTKTNFGLPLNANKLLIKARKSYLKVKNIINNYFPIFINPNINYVDFNHMIRNNSGYQNIVYKNIMDLQARNIIDWINPEKIWVKFLNSKADLSKELLLLTSLEIHLKAGLKI